MNYWDTIQSEWPAWKLNNGLSKEEVFNAAQARINELESQVMELEHEIRLLKRLRPTLDPIPTNRNMPHAGGFYICGICGQRVWAGSVHECEERR